MLLLWPISEEPVPPVLRSCLNCALFPMASSLAAVGQPARQAGRRVPEGGAAAMTVARCSSDVSRRCPETLQDVLLCWLPVWTSVALEGLFWRVCASAERDLNFISCTAGLLRWEIKTGLTSTLARFRWSAASAASVVCRHRFSNTIAGC